MSKERRVPVHRSKTEPKPQYFSSNHCIPLLGSCLDMHAFGFSRVGKGPGVTSQPNTKVSSRMCLEPGVLWIRTCQA